MASLQPIDYRRRLYAALGRIERGSLLLMAQPPMMRSTTIEFPYRQNSSLAYLTGFPEPESALFLGGHREPGDRIHFFCRDKNPQAELWNGRRIGIDKALADLPVDRVYSFSELWDKLPDLMGKTDFLACSLGLHPEWDRQLIQVLRKHKTTQRRRYKSSLVPLRDADEIMGLLRLHKQPEEIERMRRAAEITAKGFARTHAELRAGINEREIHALLLNIFLSEGAEMEAYNSIVAGGANACVLHYIQNDAPLIDGELLLVDAGAQFASYASDVTRTMPISGAFSPEQRALYEVVLKAQKEAIAKAVPGATLGQVHDGAVRVLAEGLIDLGLLQGAAAEVIETDKIKQFYPHSTSHWIGMDVHDLGIYGDASGLTELAAGMYFSVEPGIYIQPDNEDVDARWRGIGIRIEDDVLVTDAGNEVITAAIPKEIIDLEKA